jgi:putative two-component system response regulator
VTTGFDASRILLVDDSQDLVYILERILQEEGYDDVISTTDPTTAVDLYQVTRPDLVLLDLHMPGLDGLEVLARLKETEGTDLAPVVMLTGNQSPEVKVRALRGGARDFLTKPFDASEVSLRIANLLEMRRLHVQLRRQNSILEQKVEARTRDLERAKLEILQRLALAAEFRDDATGEHTQRVGRLSALMAEAMGLPADKVKLILDAAPLHDVGKIGIPDEVLLKPDRLTAQEWSVMKQHTVTGARLLSKSVSRTLKLGETIAFTHHERWDGSGYQGLEGDAIPLAGRIVSVADAFDAMTHARPYRDPMSHDDAIEEIAGGRGVQFCPKAVDAFLEVREYALRIDSRLGATPKA